VGRRGLHPAAVARTTPEARHGRSLTERLVVRSPRLFRAIVRRVLDLPESRVRTRVVTYVVRRGYAAFNRRDWEVNTLLHHPTDYRWDATSVDFAPPDARDLIGIHGYLDGMNRWLDPWDELSIEVEEIVEAGHDRILSVLRQIATGTGSGVTVVSPSFTDLLTFRDGWLVSNTLSEAP
jgi:ketosteroid isomerase-like protein